MRGRLLTVMALTLAVFVSELLPGSFYDQLGLRRKDVLLAVNGIRIDSLGASSEALQLFTNRTSLDLLVQGTEGVRTLHTETVPVE